MLTERDRDDLIAQIAAEPMTDGLRRILNTLAHAVEVREWQPVDINDFGHVEFVTMPGPATNHPAKGQ